MSPIGAPTPPPPTGRTGAWPDESTLVTEDGKPVDNIYSEKQMRFLTEPLYSHWAGPNGDRRYIATANVGLFYTYKQPPVVPDVLLSVNVTPPADFYQKENRSYFVWSYGKPPDVVIEVVSNTDGGEETEKMRLYADIRVMHYAIFDPVNYLGQGALRLFTLGKGKYQPDGDGWMEDVGLGLTLWHGSFENWDAIWLRWCDQKGNVIPTGAERAEAEHQRVEKLLALLKEKGIDPGPV